MEGKADREIERDPGQIEQGDRAEAGEIGADGIEVAQRLEAVAAVASQQWQPHQRIVYTAAERLVERAAEQNV